MKPISTLWLKRLSFIPIVNFVPFFIRFLRFIRFKRAMLLKTYLTDCGIIFLSWLIAALLAKLINSLFPNAAMILSNLVSYLVPLLYVHASIYVEEEFF